MTESQTPPPEPRHPFEEGRNSPSQRLKTRIRIPSAEIRGAPTDGHNAGTPSSAQRTRA